MAGPAHEWCGSQLRMNDESSSASDYDRNFIPSSGTSSEDTYSDSSYDHPQYHTHVIHCYPRGGSSHYGHCEGMGHGCCRGISCCPVMQPHCGPVHSYDHEGHESPWMTRYFRSLNRRLNRIIRLMSMGHRHHMVRPSVYYKIPPCPYSHHMHDHPEPPHMVRPRHPVHAAPPVHVPQREVQPERECPEHRVDRVRQLQDQMKVLRRRERAIQEARTVQERRAAAARKAQADRMKQKQLDVGCGPYHASVIRPRRPPEGRPVKPGDTVTVSVTDQVGRERLLTFLMGAGQVGRYLETGTKGMLINERRVLPVPENVHIKGLPAAPGTREVVIERIS